MTVVRVTLKNGMTEDFDSEEVAQSWIGGMEVLSIETVSDDQLEQELENRMDLLHEYQRSIGVLS